MRWSALILAVVLGVVGSANRADAEKVKTNSTAKLYSHPGEAGEVLISIKSGQTMTVLSKEGRWLKVRVSGRTGYIPRSKVDLPDDDSEIQRNTRRRPFVEGRSMKRGTGGDAPDDRVGSDATGQTDTTADVEAGGDDGDNGDKPDKPDKTSKTKSKTKKPPPDADDKPDRTDKSSKTSKTKGKKPKDDGDDGDDGDGGDKTSSKGGGDKDDGDGGDKDGGDKDGGDKDGKDGGDKDGGDSGDTRPVTHATAAVKVYEDHSKTSNVSFKVKPEDKLYVEDKSGKWTEVSEDDGSIGWVLTSQLEDVETAPVGNGKRLIDLRVRLGLTILSQGLRSAGSTAVGIPDNYNLGTEAATLALGGQYLLPYKGDFLLGGEATYAYNKSVSTIDFMSKSTGFALNDLDLRALAGYDLHKPNGMTLFGRLGYRYQSYLINNVTDLTDNSAKIPSEVDKGPMIGAALWIPRLTPKIGIRASLDAIFYSVGQTVHLEDGANPSGKGVDFGGVFTYHWMPNMDLQANYDLNYGSFSFGAPVANSQRDHMGTSVSRTDIFHTITFGITRAL